MMPLSSLTSRSLRIAIRSLPPFIWILIAILLPAVAKKASPLSAEAAWKQLERPFFAEDEKRWKAFPLEAARRFGQDIVVDCGGLKRINFAKLELAPIQIQDAKIIYDVFDDRQGRLCALCSNGQKPNLKINTNARWSTINVPNEISSKPDDWAITAGDGKVAISSDREIFTYQKGQWHRSKFTSDIPITKRYMNRRVLKNGVIYSAWSNGEWGGQIDTVDTRLGIVKTIYKDGLHPVVDIQFAPDGTLWFVTGLSHMSGISGGLFKYTDKAECISEVSGIRKERLPAAKKGLDPCSKRVNWDLEPTTFAGMSMRKDGSILVASTSLGVLQFSGNHWKRLTPEWKSEVQLCGFEVTDSGVAVFPVYERGIALCDLKTHKYQFVLPEYCKKKK